MKKTLRINEAFQLRKARDKEKGLLPEAKKYELAAVLYPDIQIAVARVNLSGLIKGDRKYIGIIAVRKIAGFLDVDPNFIFGYPSDHDKDFKRLILNKPKQL